MPLRERWRYRGWAGGLDREARRRGGLLSLGTLADLFMSASSQIFRNVIWLLNRFCFFFPNYLSLQFNKLFSSKVINIQNASLPSYFPTFYYYLFSSGYLHLLYLSGSLFSTPHHTRCLRLATAGILASQKSANAMSQSLIYCLLVYT